MECSTFVYVLANEFDTCVLVGHNPERTNETHFTATRTWPRMAHVSFEFNIGIIKCNNEKRVK